MDPSQHGARAPSGWHQAMSLDDLHGTASMRNNLKAPFDTPSHVASTPIPTLPSPEPENLRRPRWADGQQPPTPPPHYLDDAQHYPRQQDPPVHVLLRCTSYYTPLAQTQTGYISPYGTFAPAHGHLPVSNLQSGPSQQVAIPSPRLHPSVSILRSSPQEHAFRSPPAHKAPPIQYWPTRNLMVDVETRKKQEAYKIKGEAVRRKTISAKSSARQYEPITEPASTPRKRKAGILDELTSPTPARPFRRLLPSDSSRQQEPQTSFTRGPVINHHPVLQQPTPLHVNLISPQQYHAPPSFFHHHRGQYVSNTQALAYAPRPLPRPPAALPPPQHITDTYDEYRWPVQLYQLQAESDFGFAECFLQDQLGQDIYHSETFRWDAHTTTGFIKDGNRLSMLVLNNAANPFEWDPPPVSTTSIGVYGLYAHKHNEIHWTTIAPSVAEWFSSCVKQGLLTIKQEWHPNMKASDKRFHRAYWLAAKRLPLNRILNHNMAPEEPYGVLEDVDKGEFEISEDDLQHGWVGEMTSVEESEKIWQKLVDEVEGLNLELLDSEHLPIGGSERAYVVD